MRLRGHIDESSCKKSTFHRVEVTFAGLRHCKNLPTRTVGRYKMEMSFAELSIKSGPSGKKHGDSVNFLDPFRTGYVVSFFIDSRAWTFDYFGIPSEFARRN